MYKLLWMHTMGDMKLNKNQQVDKIKKNDGGVSK